MESVCGLSSRVLSDVGVEVAVEAVILCSKWLCNVNVMDGVMTANFYSFFTEPSQLQMAG